MEEVIFSPAARQDLNELFDYIARDKPLAAMNWLSSVEEKCNLIAKNPDFGDRRPELGADIRSSMVGRYVLFFRPVAEGIELVRIIPGERDIRAL